MLISIPYQLIDESCKLSSENGCMYESFLDIIYKGNKKSISDRNFGDESKCYLKDHDGYSVNISDCFIEKRKINKIKKIHKFWAKVMKIKL